MKYKIGDLVRVKSYEELSKKYHVKFDEVKKRYYLDTPASFTDSMKIYCGKEAIVVHNQGDMFYNLSFDGHVSHHVFDEDVIYKDTSNYHRIRCLSEIDMANLLNEIAKTDDVNKWYDWLHATDGVKEFFES